MISDYHQTMETYTHAYIYLIREREFLLRNEPVYKIGRGAQNADRIVKRVATGYKKGSEIWLAMRCPIATYKNVETSLKSIFGERFEKHGDGSEYFMGNPAEMVELITKIVNKSWSDVTNNASGDQHHNLNLRQLAIQSVITQMEDQLVDLNIHAESMQQLEAKLRVTLLNLQRQLVEAST